MRSAADTPGRSRIRGLALEIGGVCAAATGPGIMAQRQALFVLPGRVFAGDLPRLEIGRFRAPPEPPSEPPSGSPSPPLAMALSFLASGHSDCVRYTFWPRALRPARRRAQERPPHPQAQTRRGRAGLQPTARAGPPAARRTPVSVGFGAGWPRPPKRRRGAAAAVAAAAAAETASAGLEIAPPTAPPGAVFRLPPARDAAQPPSRPPPAPRSRPAICLARYGIEWRGVCGATTALPSAARCGAGRGAQCSAREERAMGRRPPHQPGAVAHGDSEVASV